jgi:poly(hydroxyalkanoate) depolymerase family esterase
MAPDFQKFMAEATRLTQSGDLHGASAMIHQALGRRTFSRDADAGAGAAEGEVIDVEAREIPDDGDPASAGAAPAASRAGASPPAGGAFMPGRFGQGHAARDFKLFVPPAQAGAGPRPLVVMLHGCTQDPDDFAAGTRMNALARIHGFLVLYPAQSKQANPQGCWNWFKASHQQRGRGEAATLAGMTRQVVAEHGADPSRVYVAGLSAGGAMAAVLGRAYPDLFAAVGVHSGLPAGAAEDLPGALAAMQGHGGAAAPLDVPTIVFHGDADPTVHARNGEQLFEGSPGERGTLRSETVREPGARRSATRHRRAGRDGRVVAEHWVVHGAAHAWSGGDRSGSYTDPDGPDASALMLRFFLEHRLDRGR